ncbi:secreted protein [Melampsora americana]|nr:secreted protein [Melampsora americana]
MLALFFPIVLFALSAFSSTSAQTTNQGRTIQCTTYGRANTNQPICNDLYRCSGQCTGPFITAQNCFLTSNNTDFLGNPKPNTPANPAVPKVVCNVGYGRNTAAARACLTTTGTYSCNGGIVAGTYATCNKCVAP